MHEPEPDIEDVLQVEDDGLTAVPVCLTETRTPVRVSVLPRVGGATRTRTIGTTAPGVRVLTADPRRARAVLMCIDQAMYVAYSKAAAEDLSTMAVWPAGTPLTIEAVTEVWVIADTAAAAVSIITEVWADGDG